MRRVLILLLFYIPNLMISQQNLGCGGEEFNSMINKLLEENKKNHLNAVRVLSSKNTDRFIPSPAFIWPLRAAPPYADIPNYYSIFNFVDLDPAVDEILDFNCGERTYDDHKGCDIIIWPFIWHMMDNDYVEVIAAADGIVTTVIDNNNNDDNCLGGNSANNSNNVVIISHSDGSRSIYYHIKSGSVPVITNDTVLAGDKIALVGSSGWSTGPHLHFEVRDANNDVIEPFSGSCNSTTTNSWWQNQKPYWEPHLNRIMCHSANPQLLGYNADWCDNEILYGKNNFFIGDNIYYGIALTDIQTNMNVSINITNPNGFPYISYSYLHTGSNNPAKYLVYNHVISENATAGTYQIKVTYNQVSYYHYFTVNCPSTLTISNDLALDNGFHAGTTLNCSSLLIQGGSPPAYANTKLKLQAGTQVILKPGFHAPTGTYAYTKIRGCNFTH